MVDCVGDAVHLDLVRARLSVAQGSGRVNRLQEPCVSPYSGQTTVQSSHCFGARQCHHWVFVTSSNSTLDDLFLFSLCPVLQILEAQKKFRKLNSCELENGDSPKGARSQEKEKKKVAQQCNHLGADDARP